MHLRSIMTHDCLIWLFGLTDRQSRSLAELPTVKGLKPTFVEMDSLPDKKPGRKEKLPDLVILSENAAVTAKDVRRLVGDEAMIVLWQGVPGTPDKVTLSVIDDLWETPGETLLAFRWSRTAEELWRRYHAWLVYTFWQTTLNMVPDLMWYKNVDGLHLEINDALAKTVGKEKDDCRGKRHGYIWGLSPEEYEKGEFACHESDRQVMESGELVIGAEQVLDNGELRDLRTYKTPLFDKEGKIFGTAGVAQDITLLNRYHKKILDMAHRDELTGLANRRYFYEYIQEFRKKQAVCVFSIDLDHFKQVNDTYGHKAGDEALRAVSEVMKGSFPSTGLACRFGGDEFLVLLLGNLSANEARSIAENFMENLRELFSAQKKFSVLTASVGIAVTHDIDCAIDDLIKASDAALYEAKEAGRNCVRVAHHDSCADGTLLNLDE